MTLPRAFVDAAREVFLHADPRRLPLIHRLALRIADDPQAWADPLHEDRLQFDRLLREVRREIHKMHAFVRFRRLEGADPAPDEGGAAGAVARLRGDGARRGGGSSRRLVRTGAPRAGGRRAVLRAPLRDHALGHPHATRQRRMGRPGAVVRPGRAPRGRAAADAGEALWLAYYRSIFNPARVKVAMMKKEMPVRFWKNLPEAAAVPELLAQAPQRRQRMVDDGGVSRSRRRRPADAGGRGCRPGRARRRWRRWRAGPRAVATARARRRPRRRFSARAGSMPA